MTVAAQRARSRGAWTTWFCGCLPLLLAGCASWLGTAPAPATTDGTARAEPPGAPVVRVEVQAPGNLKSLLERYLDLSRLATMTRGDAVTDTELGRLVDAAPSQVRDLLQTEGFFTPEVSVRRQAAAEPGQPERVVVTVQPGPRAEVSRVTLEFEGALEAEAGRGDRRAQALLADLRSTWPLPPGHGFRNRDWIDAKTVTLARVRAAGYATAAWIGTGAEVDPATHGARLFLVLDSGPLFRSGALQVEGLVRQDSRTVENIANFPPGTPVSETLLLDFQERLQKAGLFESVTVTLDPDPARAAAAPIIVKLREQPIQVYTFGLGISANTGPRASVEHVYRRFFGLPATTSNKFEWGQLRQYWSGELSTHMGANLYRNLLGGVVERLESDTDVVLSQRLRLGRSQETARRDRFYFAEVERGERETDLKRVSTIAISANYHLVLRRLDSILLPTDGWTLALQGGLGRSHGSDSSSGLFSRLYARGTWYRPIGGGWFGQARLELGKVLLPSGVAAPDSQLWRAGGDDSVRGYGYRTLGPIVDGSISSGPALLTSSVELAHPIYAALPSLWGAVFVDAGRAGSDFGGLNPALGYGAGVRWRSPVGPLKLDIAYGQEVRKFRLHFSVGVVF